MLGCDGPPPSAPSDETDRPAFQLSFSSTVLLHEDFESYAEESNLDGQGGWVLVAGPGPVLVGTGPLGSKSAHGLVNPGVNVIQYIDHSITWDGTGTLQVSFDSFMKRPPPRWSHNSGISLIDHALPAINQVGWNCDCGVECRISATNPPGWTFWAGAGRLERFPGGYDQPVHLEIVVDAVNQELFGRADLGAGIIESMHYSTVGLDLAAMSRVMLFQDFRGTRGGEFDNIVVSLAAVEVDIDIKPGSDPNCFNNDGHGVIPVAILGAADFDVTQIDPSTVQLEGLAVGARGKSNKLMAHVEDINSDGFDDLVVQIEDVDGAFTSGSGVATLTGQLWDGTAIEGSDEICVVP
jgi:hypothetical protein